MIIVIMMKMKMSMKKKTEKILEEIEKIGYDRKYVMNCVKNNELCNAYAIFYLMMNYKDI